MVWPTTQAGTTNLDEGGDNPALARGDLKQAVDNINAVQSEITINNTSPALDELLQHDGTEFVNQDLIMKHYEERILNLGTTGTIDIDLAAEPVQTIAALGNITLTFSNPGTNAKSVSVWFKHDGAARTITWPAGTRFAYGDSDISTVSGAIDLLVIEQVTLWSTSYKMVSILRDFKV